MMTFERFKEMENGYLAGQAAETVELLRRVYDACVRAGLNVGVICHRAEVGNDDTGYRFAAIEIISKRNGADHDVSVDVSIYENNGYHTCKRIARVRVPKNASDKVIWNRLQKLTA